jgi:hypothetical protein
MVGIININAMKIGFTLLALLAVGVSISSCKKTDELKPNADLNANDSSLLASSSTLNVVTTVAGSFYSSGPTLVDGTGRNARFLSPRGIQIMDDLMYIADGNDGVIRTLTPGGTVSTIKLPAAAIGYQMHNPWYVGVAKDGTINVATEFSAFSDSPEAWIFKPNQPAVFFSYYYASYRNLVKDPYEDFFWYTEGFSVSQFKQGGYDYVGTNRHFFNIDSLYNYPTQHASLRALFVGYNKVKYVSDGQFIYKLTPSGVSQRIFKHLDPERTFSGITCIVANKDSRTLYVADAGYIKRIDSGKLTTIAGPKFWQNDPGADVHAFYLALSKDESTLYFSDPVAKTIRKIRLK